ncbi:hypothetical protein B0H14DRAFT_2404259, partial [Mycena olivaceomarginata]
STRNTRIERLWVEVGTQFARRWRAFFTRLGRMHSLDRKNPMHLWLLHRLFLDQLNDDCHEFQEEWNHHPMSGNMTGGQSPEAMRLLGQITHGVYKDPLEDVHLETINRYYGVEGSRRRRRNGQTGAGQASDESSEEDEGEEVDVDEEEELENQIAAEQAQNIRHAPVKVARHGSPFPEDAEMEQDFLDLLEEVLAQADVLPQNYGVLEEEWDEEEYPELEIIRTGTKGKELRIILPREEWYDRAVRWAQALDLLNRVLEELSYEY